MLYVLRYNTTKTTGILSDDFQQSYANKDYIRNIIW